MVQRIRYQKYDVHGRYDNEQVPHPKFFAQGRVCKIENKPGDPEGDDTDHDKPKRVYDLEILRRNYYRDGVQESPNDYLDAEEKEAAYAAVACIAKPKQAKDISKNTAKYY